MKLKSILTAAVLASGVLTDAAIATPTLVGTATLKTADDLTVIKDGNTTYDFLDLTATKGMSVTSALTAFGTDKFGFANSDDLTRLFGAFGFTFAANNATAYMSITQQQANSFVADLGNTWPWGTVGASFGIYNNLDYGVGYTCVSWGTCLNNAFTSNSDYSSNGNSLMGVFLVRTETAKVLEPTSTPPSTSVPEPTSVALLGLGIAGLAAARRRKAK